MLCEGVCCERGGGGGGGVRIWQSERLQGEGCLRRSYSLSSHRGLGFFAAAYTVGLSRGGLASALF